jgi:hypothetical protein
MHVLLAVLVFLTPAGPVTVNLALPFPTLAACEFALANGELMADAPLVAGSAECRAL